MSNHKPLRILLLTPGFPGDEQETNCLTYLQNYLLAFKQVHPHVQFQVISFQYPFDTKNYLWNDILVYALGGGNGSLLKRPFLWRKAWKLAKKLHQENPFDCIHSLWLKECSFVGHYLGKKLHVKHISVAMGTEVFTNNHYLRILPLNRINLICLSHFQRKKLLETVNLKQKPHIIPWGLGPREETALIPFQERPHDLLNVGYLNATKQISLFLQIVAACKKNIPGIRAVLVGEDYSQGQIDVQIEKLGIRENLIKYPLLSNEEVISLMDQSKVLVHSSSYESEGYVFLEALRSGMSICSRQVGIAAPGEQWLVVESEKEFVDATLQALEVKRTQSILSYPLEQTMAEYLVIYEEKSNSL